MKPADTTSTKLTPAERLILHAQSAACLRAEAGAIREQLLMVKSWQSQRLAVCHADLLSHPRYGVATRFFMQDLYGAKDFSARDQQLLRIIPSLTRFLPDGALATIADAVELDALSERLDQAMARWLLEHYPGPCEEAEGTLQVAHQQAQNMINLERYREALLYVSEIDVRLAQVGLVGQIGTSLDRLVRKPMLGTLVSAMGPMARAAGLADMHEFLERGFAAFKAMKGAQEFVAVIVYREEMLMRGLWGHGSWNELMSVVSSRKVA